MYIYSYVYICMLYYNWMSGSVPDEVELCIWGIVVYIYI